MLRQGSDKQQARDLSKEVLPACKCDRLVSLIQIVRIHLKHFSFGMPADNSPRTPIDLLDLALWSLIGPSTLNKLKLCPSKNACKRRQRWSHVIHVCSHAALAKFSLTNFTPSGLPACFSHKNSLHWQRSLLASNVRITRNIESPLVGFDCL